LTQLDATIRATKANSPPGVTKAQEALRVVLLHELGKVGANIIKDAGELRFDFDISDKSKDLTINLAITGQPGSDFAKTIKNLGELRSPLAGIGGKDAAFHAAVQLSVPDDLGKLFGAALEDAIAKDLAALQDAELKAQARMVLQAVAPTFKAGEFHSVAALVGPKQDRYALIYALKITDGESLGKLTTDLIKEALATMPKAEKAKYQLDFASVGAIKIHRFDLANDTDDANPLKKLTGDSRLFLAFRKDALFVAVGQDALGVLQSAIANTESAPSVPFVWDVDIARLSPLLAETAEQKALIAKLFPRGQTARIRLSIEGGASLNARLQMQLNVLEFAVKSQQK
jgi:hypothetical protein